MAERFLLSSVLCRRAFDGRLQRTSTNYCISAGHIEIHLHTVQRCAARSGLYESINQPKYLPCRNLIRWRLRRSPEEKPLSRLHATLCNHSSGRRSCCAKDWHAISKPPSSSALPFWSPRSSRPTASRPRQLTHPLLLMVPHELPPPFHA